MKYIVFDIQNILDFLRLANLYIPKIQSHIGTNLVVRIDPIKNEICFCVKNRYKYISKIFPMTLKTHEDEKMASEMKELNLIDFEWFVVRDEKEYQNIQEQKGIMFSNNTFLFALDLAAFIDILKQISSNKKETNEVKYFMNSSSIFVYNNSKQYQLAINFSIQNNFIETDTNIQNVMKSLELDKDNLLLLFSMIDRLSLSPSLYCYINYKDKDKIFKICIQTNTLIYSAALPALDNDMKIKTFQITLQLKTLIELQKLLLLENEGLIKLQIGLDSIILFNERLTFRVAHINKNYIHHFDQINKLHKDTTVVTDVKIDHLKEGLDTVSVLKENKLQTIGFESTKTELSLQNSTWASAAKYVINNENQMETYFTISQNDLGIILRKFIKDISVKICISKNSSYIIIMDDGNSSPQKLFQSFIIPCINS